MFLLLSSSGDQDPAQEVDQGKISLSILLLKLGSSRRCLGTLVGGYTLRELIFAGTNFAIFNQFLIPSRLPKCDRLQH